MKTHCLPLVLLHPKIATVLHFSIGILSTSIFRNWSDYLFKIFKKISDWFIFPKFLFALHEIQELNPISWWWIFCKRGVVRDNSLHLILISEAFQKFFSMAAFAKGSSNSYVEYKHFVTWRISLIHFMLNEFKIELKELFFFVFLYRNISQLLFMDFCQSLRSNGKPKAT